ncbi:MAG: hypothetical protein P4M08_01195 [Oligoflexia bacterium]|nr:hypothetical protein [Oligoflexia bacterium]
MKSVQLAVFFAAVALCGQASFAGQIDPSIASMSCGAMKSTDAPVSVDYIAGSDKVMVTENSKTTTYDLLQLLPGVDGELQLVGYNSEIGYLQMNIISGKTTMMLQGDKVEYLSCIVNQ